jgi:hypothetical protein
MVIYALVDANTWELDPDLIFTDVAVAGPTSEKLRMVLVAIEVHPDKPSKRLWSGMRKVYADRTGWEWFGPDMAMLDAAPVSW